MKPYRITLLGGLKFQYGEQIITRFRTQKTATLLAYLALHRGPQPREVLADLLWPDDAPDDARHSLRMALSSLRGQLENLNGGQHQEPLFETTRFSVGLRAAAVSTDVADFEAALKSARQADDAEQRAHFYAVVSELYWGAFLPGFYDDWCLEAAARLEVALDEAGQFLAHWRAAPTAHTPRGAPAQQRKIAPNTGATHILTLLVCDGAAHTPAQKRQLKSGGAAPFPLDPNLRAKRHAWQFSSASAALAGATWLHCRRPRLSSMSAPIRCGDR